MFECMTILAILPHHGGAWLEMLQGGVWTLSAFVASEECLMHFADHPARTLSLGDSRSSNRTLRELWCAAEMSKGAQTLLNTYRDQWEWRENQLTQLPHGNSDWWTAQVGVLDVSLLFACLAAADIRSASQWSSRWRLFALTAVHAVEGVHLRAVGVGRQ